MVQFVANLRLADLPAAAIQQGEAAILDCVACIVAGSGTPPAQIARGWVEAFEGKPEATVIGTGLRVPAMLAAEANGIAGHALDYDDVSMWMTHPSVALVPALFALAEARGLSGTAVAEAYIAGFEVQARLCKAMNPQHYAAGWHSTGTVGTVGAAAAAAKLLGFDKDHIRTAIAISTSAAGGLRANFGSMMKPFHAGLAASNGVRAATLAERGFTSGETIFDGARSYPEIFAGEGGVTTLPDGLFGADQPLEILESGIAFKRFACCGAIHTALDAAIDLATTTPFDAQDVEVVDCDVNRMTPDILEFHIAETPMQGKMSLEYCMAAAILDRQVGLAQFEEERVTRPDIQALQRRIRMTVDEAIPVDYAVFPSRVRITLKDGSVHERFVERPRGYPSDPLSHAELEAKFRDCASGILPEAMVHFALRLLGALAEQPSVIPLMEALRAR
jgi:2-methylcitrate dehydratase PrpD